MNKENEASPGNDLIDFIKLGPQGGKIIVDDKPYRKTVGAMVLVRLGALRQNTGKRENPPYREFTNDEWTNAVGWMNREIARVTGREPAPVRDSNIWYSESARLLGESTQPEDYKNTMLRLLIPLSNAIERWNAAELPLEVAD